MLMAIAWVGDDLRCVVAPPIVAVVVPVVTVMVVVMAVVMVPVIVVMVAVVISVVTTTVVTATMMSAAVVAVASQGNGGESRQNDGQSKPFQGDGNASHGSHFVSFLSVYGLGWVIRSQPRYHSRRRNAAVVTTDFYETLIATREQPGRFGDAGLHVHPVLLLSLRDWRTDRLPGPEPGVAPVLAPHRPRRGRLQALGEPPERQMDRLPPPGHRRDRQRPEARRLGRSPAASRVARRGSVVRVDRAPPARPSPVRECTAAGRARCRR